MIMFWQVIWIKRREVQMCDTLVKASRISSLNYWVKEIKQILMEVKIEKYYALLLDYTLDCSHME